MKQIQASTCLAALTRFRAESSAINKSYPKAPRENFYEGEFEVVTLDWKTEFGSLLRALTLQEVISLGTPDPKITPHTSGRVGPAIHPPFMRNGTYLGWNADKHAASGNIIMLDIDRIPAHVRSFCEESQSLTDLLVQILEDLPELDYLLSSTQTGVWGYASAGAFIYEENNEGRKQVTGLTGAHFYFLLPCDQDPMAFRSWMKSALILKGLADSHHCYIYENKNCTTEVRTYIDQKAIGKERLDFIAGTACADGFVQCRPAPEFFEFDPPVKVGALPNFKALDASVSPAANRIARDLVMKYRLQPEFQERLSIAAEEKAKAWKSSPRSAKVALDLLQHNIVSGMTHVYLDSEPNHPVEAWRLLLDPEDYDGVTMADPRDDERRKNKAIFFARCPVKFLSEENPSLVAGAPAIFGFKGGEAIMQIKMDLPSVLGMMEGKTQEEMLDEYGENWYKLLADGNGLTPAESEEILQTLKSRWGQSQKSAQKLISAALKQETKKSASVAMREVIDEFDQRFSLLKSGEVITAIWEETNPLFPNATVVAQLPKTAFCEWHRRTIYDMNEKGQIKALNAAQLWWDREHKIKYSGVVFDPTTTDKTISHVRETDCGREQVEHFFNMFRGTSVAALAPKDRACKGECCDGKGCLHWFLNSPDGMAAIDSYRKTDPESKDAEWRTWGCEFSKRSKANCKTSCLWYYRSLYENICIGRSGLFKWGLDWIADLFQNPAERKGTAFVMQGGQGVGKGLVVAPLGRIYSQHFYHAQTKREVIGKFNLHVAHLIILYADEAKWGGDKSEEGAWKAFITEELKGIEAKGKNMYQIRNHVRMIIASNATWVTPTESDDRRHFILEARSKFQNGVSSSSAPGKGKFDAYWWRVSNIDDSALLWDLMGREITSTLRVAPATEGLIAQKMQSMSLEDQFIGWMITDAPAMFDVPLGSSEIYSLLEKSGIKFNAEHIKQKGFTQSLTSKLLPECGEKVKNVGLKKERGIMLYKAQVMDWYASRFEYEYNEEEDM